MGARRWRAGLLAGLAAFGALCVDGAAQAPGPAPSEEAYKYFELNCQSCHTIGGGKLAGPDLKGALDRKDREWLTAFVTNPKAVIDSGDAYAQGLLREARGVVMPTPAGMTKDLAGKLIDLIAIESAAEKSRFAGLQVSDRPLTEADIARGQRLFEGGEDFASGAPACYSCHTVQGARMFGGGRLGPDLTSAYARLEGRNALAAWLGAPPSPVMAPIYRAQPIDGEEILALTAYLKQQSESGVTEAAPSGLGFVLGGFFLAAILLVLFDVIWSGRYRATRRPLLEQRLLGRRLMEERNR